MTPAYWIEYNTTAHGGWGTFEGPTHDNLGAVVMEVATTLWDQGIDCDFRVRCFDDAGFCDVTGDVAEAIVARDPIMAERFPQLAQYAPTDEPDDRDDIEYEKAAYRANQ